VSLSSWSPCTPIQEASREDGGVLADAHGFAHDHDACDEDDENDPQADERDDSKNQPCRAGINAQPPSRYGAAARVCAHERNGACTGSAHAQMERNKHANAGQRRRHGAFERERHHVLDRQERDITGLMARVLCISPSPNPACGEHREQEQEQEQEQDEDEDEDEVEDEDEDEDEAMGWSPPSPRVRGQARPTRDDGHGARAYDDDDILRIGDSARDAAAGVRKGDRHARLRLPARRRKRPRRRAPLGRASFRNELAAVGARHGVVDAPHAAGDDGTPASAVHIARDGGARGLVASDRNIASRRAAAPLDGARRARAADQLPRDYAQGGASLRVNGGRRPSRPWADW